MAGRQRMRNLALLTAALTVVSITGCGGKKAPTLVITTSSLAAGEFGVTYNATLTSTGGKTPISWSIVSGTLPNGLTLGTTGTISGNPTSAGSFNFTVQARDSAKKAQTATQALSIEITDPLRITNSSLAGGVVGEPYSRTINVTGGVPPYAWAVTSGSLPADLTLGPGSGVLSGTPTVATTSNFTVTVTDSDSPAQSVSQAYSITISLAAVGRNNTIGTATPLSNGTFAASLSPIGDPVTILDPDVDVYEITAGVGDIVIIEIDAENLPVASFVDSVMEITDASGTRLTTCKNIGTDDGVTGAPDATPTAFDDVCLNDDQVLGVIRDSFMELQVPAGATTFYVRVLDWTGNARPDMRYEIIVSGAN